MLAIDQAFPRTGRSKHGTGEMLAKRQVVAAQDDLDDVRRLHHPIPGAMPAPKTDWPVLFQAAPRTV